MLPITERARFSTNFSPAGNDHRPILTVRFPWSLKRDRGCHLPPDNGYDRTRSDREQLVVESEYLTPVGQAGVGRLAVDGLDRGLSLVLPTLVALFKR